jgi:large subunit ribosomal protein L24
VQLWNAAAGKPGRTGIKTLENGRKVRYFKSTGETVDLV